MSELALDPVRRLRVLAAALPGTALAERIVEAPFEAVWAVAGDLEKGVPRYERTVTRVRTERGGGTDRLIVHTRDVLGRERTFDAVLRSGWCWMQSGRLVIGLAAAPAGHGRTHLAHLEGSISSLTRPLRPVLRRKLKSELRHIEQLARQATDPRS